MSVQPSLWIPRRLSRRSGVAAKADFSPFRVGASFGSASFMNDPLSQVIALLQPRTVFAKRISGAGRWGVRYSEFGHPSFCAVLEGRCRLAVDGHGP